MNSKATLSLLLPLTIAAACMAADYELVVPDTDAFRNAEGITVFDTSSQLGKDDRIVRVIYGGLPEGTGNSRVLANTTPHAAIIGMPGSVKGFDGKVQLGAGKGPDTAPLAGVVEVKILPTPPVAQTMWEKMMSPPWVWLVAFGSAALVTAFVLNLRIRGNYFMANKQSRNAFLDSVAEIKERLDGIETAQHNLVKKPPVLKYFDNQIKSFEARLTAIESNVVQNSGSLSDAQGKLGTLESQYSKLAAASDASHRDQSALQAKIERLDQSIAATSGSLATKFQQVLDKQQIVESNLASLQSLEDTVKSLQKEVASTEPRLRALAEQVSNVERRSTENSVNVIEQFGDVVAQSAVLANQLSSLGTQVEKNAAALETLSVQVKQVDRFQDLENRLSEFVNEVAEKLANTFADLQKADVKAAKWKTDMDNLATQMQEKLDSVKSSIEELHRAQSAAPNLSELVSAVESKRSKSDKSDPGDLRFQALAADLNAMRQEMDSKMQTITAPIQRMKSDIEARMNSLAEPLAGIASIRQEMEARLASLAGPIEELLRRSNEQPTVVYVPSEPKPSEAPTLAKEPEMPQVSAQVVLEPTKKPEVVVEKPEPKLEESAPPVVIPESESETESVVDPEVQQNWCSAGGSSARLWSASIGENMSLIKAEKSVRPLTPVDTPPAKFPVASAAYLDGRVVYAHGDAVRAFWPGRDDNAVSLYGPMPQDDWRFLVNKRTAFCVQKDRIEIVSLVGWSTQHVFNGHYANQMHTGELWAGLLVQDDGLLVDVRDNSGTQRGKPRKLKVAPTEKVHMAGYGANIYVLTESGHLSVVGNDKAEEIAVFEKAKWLQLSVVRNTLYALAQAQKEVLVISYDTKKGTTKEVRFSGTTLPQAAIIGDKMYLASEKSSDITVINLKKMVVAETKTVTSTQGIRKIVGLQSGKEHYLALVTIDFDNRAGRAAIYDVRSGGELTLCPVDQPHVDLVPAENKLVVITSTSYQNIVRVFAPFVAEARAAA